MPLPFSHKTHTEYWGKTWPSTANYQTVATPSPGKTRVAQLCSKRASVWYLVLRTSMTSSKKAIGESSVSDNSVHMLAHHVLKSLNVIIATLKQVEAHPAFTISGGTPWKSVEARPLQVRLKLTGEPPLVFVLLQKLDDREIDDFHRPRMKFTLPVRFLVSNSYFLSDFMGWM